MGATTFNRSRRISSEADPERQQRVKDKAYAAPAPVPQSQTTQETPSAPPVVQSQQEIDLQAESHPVKKRGRPRKADTADGDAA